MISAERCFFHISEIKKRVEKKYYCKKEFTEDLDDAAEDIVDKLNSFHWTLSRFGKDYDPGSKIGCGGGNVESDKKVEKRVLIGLMLLELGTLFGIN